MGIPNQVGKGNSRDQGESHPGTGNRIRKRLVFSIDKSQREYCRRKNKIERQGSAKTVVPCNGNKQNGCQQLYCGITHRDVLFALPALGAQENVTKDRYVVVKRDRRAARRTARVWKDDRLSVRNAMNYNVEKTADDRAKNSRDHVSKERGNDVQVRHLNPYYPRSVFPKASSASKTHGALRSSQS